MHFKKSIFCMIIVVIVIGPIGSVVTPSAIGTATASEASDLVVTGSGDSTTQGETVTVEFDLENTGTTAINDTGVINLYLDTELPEGWTVVSHSDDGGDWNGDQWAWPGIDAGEVKAPSLTLRAPSNATAGSVNVSATADTIFTDGEDTGTATITVADRSDESALTAQQGLATHNGSAYVVSDGDIVTTDPSGEEVIDSFDAPDGRSRGLARGGGSLWFADGVGPDFDGEIVELDPDTGEVRSRISTAYDPRGLAYTNGSLWVADITANDIVEYSPDGEELRRFDVPTTTPRGLAGFDDSLWLGTMDATLYEFDTNGTMLTETGARNTTYGGLAANETALFGPDEDGQLTVLRELEIPNGDTPGPGDPIAALSESESNVTVGPGETIEVEYKLTNAGDRDGNVTRVTIEQYPTSWNITSDLSGWKGFRTAWVDVPLSPGEEYVATGNVTVPDDASAGTYTITATGSVTPDIQDRATTTVTVSGNDTTEDETGENETESDEIPLAGQSVTVDELLQTLTAYTDETTIDGQPVDYDAVLHVVRAFNAGATVPGPVSDGANPDVKVSAPDSVGPGDSFSVTYELENTGTAAANAAGLNLTVPETVEVDSIDTNGDGVEERDSAIFTEGLATGATRTVTVEFTVSEAADQGEKIEIDGRASIGAATDANTTVSVARSDAGSGGDEDGDDDSNTGTQSQTETLTLHAVDVPETVRSNTTFSATYDIENTGEATNAYTVEMALDRDNVTVTGFSGDIQSSAVDNQPPSASTEAVAVGARATVTVDYQVAANTTGNASLTATARNPLAGNQTSLSQNVSIQTTAAAPADPTQRALQITGKPDPGQLTQNDVTAVITRFNRGQSINNVDINQDDVTATITLFERN